jgi:hypothetical protein
VVFANDRQIESPDQVIEEAEKMSALGTGITGGEPFLCLDRVAEYCCLLKRHFGTDHHIHLYTATAPTSEELEKLRGLVDEIRFHPPRECWETILDSGYIMAAQHAREMGFFVGIEVPALPGLGLLAPALPYIDFLNINELEWGETNAATMRERGYELSDGTHNAVRGARGWADELLEHENVHWCASSFKDAVQLRERLKRIATNTARAFDEVTDDGTVVYGVLELPAVGRDACLARCRDDLEPGSFSEFPDRIEMAWWLLGGLGAEVPGKRYVVERYPDGGMVVEVTPL